MLVRTIKSPVKLHYFICSLGRRCRRFFLLLCSSYSYSFDCFFFSCLHKHWITVKEESKNNDLKVIHALDFYKYTESSFLMHVNVFVFLSVPSSQWLNFSFVCLFVRSIDLNLASFSISVKLKVFNLFYFKFNRTIRNIHDDVTIT